jgi:uncharacterized membrane protein HdeD (DUF308 family)
MPLLKKYLLGLLLTLVGGLALTHGIVTTNGWETTLGVVLLTVGVLLMAYRLIVRRNTPTPAP